jgi:flagellin-specific chaperone FliS
MTNLGMARAQFEEAQKAMQQGDWAKFGKAMEALQEILERYKR